MQGWAAVAEGARGLFFFVYGPCDGAPRDRYWRKTEQWGGVKTLFGELGPLTPLLLRLKRAEDKDALLKAKDPAAPLTIRAFTRRGQPDGNAKGLYAVVFNRNDTARVAVALEGEATQKAEVVWDVKRGRAAADLSLGPGEGTLLWVGSRDQLAADRPLLGTRQRPR